MIVNWQTGVNTRILRNGTNWDKPVKFIEDVTRSGKPKRRMAYSYSREQFVVKMRFTPTEKALFDSWFENTTVNGLYPFYFPTIDEQGHTNTSVYQFTQDGSPSFSNSNGLNIDCTMKWEKV